MEPDILFDSTITTKTTNAVGSVCTDHNTDSDLTSDITSSSSLQGSLSDYQVGFLGARKAGAEA